MKPTPRAGARGPGVSFNQNFIRDLGSTLKLDDPVAVFAHVFSKMADRVVVYPTENYYYWSFNTRSLVIWGNVRLDAQDRDKGVLHIGYFRYDENGKFQDIDGWGAELTAKNGVLVSKVSRFVYTVAFKGRTVTFQLNDIGMAPPKRAKLRPDEVYVGPVYDESGVRFFLIFNKTTNHFHYLLNEEVAAPEEYRRLNKDVIVGKRTGFAFYDDKAMNRRMLVGVNGWNIRRNNYYDGPFDQLPDNYIDQTKIGAYMERAYPHLKGKLTRYGSMIKNPDNRVAIDAYFVYDHEEQLRFVTSCRQTHPKNKAKFYACITPTRQ